MEQFEMFGFWCAKYINNKQLTTAKKKSIVESVLRCRNAECRRREKMQKWEETNE